MSVRTARTWQRGRLPSEKKGKRRWRTRPDPFAGVWAEEVEPLLRSDVEGALKATTILEWLDERHPGRFSLSQLRTLQRRLRDWRALSGPDREVFFEQEHPPGREAQVDFTHCGELGVTICGEPFGHLLFHFVLSHSGWRYVDVAYGETFAALVKPESTDRRREDSGRGQGSYKRDDGCLNSGRLEVGGGLQALLWAPMGPVLAVVSEMAG